MNRIGFLFSVLFFGFVFQGISSPSSQIEVFEKQQPDTTFIYLKDYGLKKTRKKDCTDVITKALKDIDNNIPTVIRFSRGEYHFYPGESLKRNYYESGTSNINPRNCALVFENRSNLIIDGNGSTLIFHEQIQPFSFDSCSNIVLRNFNIDWEQPLTAQGKVVKVNDEFIELTIDLKESPCQVGDDGVLYFTSGKNVKEPWKSTVEFDREGRYIVPQTGDQGCLGKGWENYVAENIIPGVIRLYYPFLRKPAIGNYLVFRHTEKNHSGIFIQDSKNVTIQNVKLYHAAGLGVLAQFCENLTFNEFRAIPNRAKNRYFSGSDGGIQITNCKGQITISDCEFAGLMDDPINLNGFGVQVIEKVADNQLRCQFVHLQNSILNWAHPGDSIRFIETLATKTLGTGVIESISPLDANNFMLVFREKIPALIKTKDVLENLSWTPNVTISNSQFKSCRASGIQVSTAGKIVIKNNLFESSGSAVLVVGGANSWLESGAATDVLIEDNEFTDLCNSSLYQFCEGIISVYPEIPVHNEKTPQYYRNIRIINNRFNPFDYPILFARSVDGLTFENNTITRSTRFEPNHSGKYSFTFEACKRISINNNTLSDDVLGKNVLLKWTPPEELDSLQPELTIRSVKIEE